MRSLFFGLAVLTLAGCQQNKPVSELSYTELKQVAAQIEQRCVDQGAPRGSSGWDMCIKQEATRETARRNRARQIADSTVICNQVGSSTICM